MTTSLVCDADNAKARRSQRAVQGFHLLLAPEPTAARDGGGILAEETHGFYLAGTRRALRILGRRPEDMRTVLLSPLSAPCRCSEPAHLSKPRILSCITSSTSRSERCWTVPPELWPPPPVGSGCRPSRSSGGVLCWKAYTLPGDVSLRITPEHFSCGGVADFAGLFRDLPT